MGIKNMNVNYREVKIDLNITIFGKQHNLWTKGHRNYDNDYDHECFKSLNLLKEKINILFFYRNFWTLQKHINITCRVRAKHNK